MIAQTRATSDSHALTSLDLLQDLLGATGQRDFAVRFWDGSTWRPGESSEPVRFTLVLQHPGALRSMFLPPTDLNLFEAYIFNDYDVEGDLESFLTILDEYIDDRGPAGRLDQLHFARRLMSLPKTGQRRPARPPFSLRGKRHSKGRDHRVISYHYDQSNDFYALFLDPYMTYSCAYFLAETEDLNEAQERKLDYVCRKLRLQPGERLLDLGCGWGALMIYAAKHYGVEVDGVTISEPQAEFTLRRIAEAGLKGRCRVVIRDYRDLEPRGEYDKVATLEVLEHIGAAMLPDFCKAIWGQLRPGGTGLIQAIACPGRVWALDESNFIGRYVFPDSELLPIGRVLQAAEDAGFDVRDVESFRDHYPSTLRHWVRRLDDRADEARALVGDTTYRIWRLYVSIAALGFKTRRLTVFESLLSKPNRAQSGLPLTRADWYR